MDPRHATLLGATGSGKTSAALMAAHGAPRVLVLDHENDPLWDPLPEIRNPRGAVELVTRHAADDWQAVLRLPSVDHDLALLDALMEVQERDPDLPPVLVVMEEGTLYSDAVAATPQAVIDLLQRGRKRGIVALTIAQETSDLDTSIRRQSFLTVSFQQSPPYTSDVQAQFDPADRLARLETVDPYTRPEYGRHYLTDPPDRDLFDHLRHAVLAERPGGLPENWTPPRSL